MRKRIWSACIACGLALLASWEVRAAEYPQPTQGDYVIHDFHFHNGATLPELKIHYRTVGKPQRDEKGVVRNAVLIMHGTTGSGKQFDVPGFAGELFGKASCSMPRSTSSSCPTTSATANRANPATACTPSFQITAMPTWSRPNTSSSPMA